MNIYEKVAAARVALQDAQLKKSGQNKFAGYTYYELSDIMPKVNELAQEYKLLPMVSFEKDVATMVIVDAEKPEDKMVFTSPMSTAALKGCHEVQNLGAVETYIRRYLYLVAFEITENDALDTTMGQTPAVQAPSYAPRPQYQAQPPAAQVGAGTMQAVCVSVNEQFVSKNGKRGIMLTLDISGQRQNDWIWEGQYFTKKYDSVLACFGITTGRIGEIVNRQGYVQLKQNGQYTNVIYLPAQQQQPPAASMPLNEDIPF